jgi:hypothetical protein
MSAIDFTDYENGELIPAGTDAILHLKVKYGEGTDSVLTLTKNRDAEVLKLEATVAEGPHARRKLWIDLLVLGTTDNQKMMADRNKAILKSIVESARDIDPGDKSPEARRARTLNWRDFDGLRAQAIIGVQPARTDKETGQTYQARNCIDRIITRNMPGWRGPIQQFNDDPPFGNTPPAAAAPAAAAPNGPAAATPAAPQTQPIVKPAWAR